MKVAHFVESFSQISETFIYNKIQGLEDKGVDNVVYATKVISSRCFEKVIELEKKILLSDRIGFKLHFLLKHEARLKYFDLRIFANSLESELIKNKPDVIYAHFGPLGCSVLPIAQKFDIPLICNFYGYDVSSTLKSSFWRNRYKKDIPYFAASVGISSFICNQLHSFSSKDKVYKIHLGVDEEASPKKTESAGQAIRLVFIGRFVEKKSPLELIESFSILNSRLDKRVKIELHLIGDGPLFNESKQLVAQKKLNNIRFYGALDHDQAMKVLVHSDIYVQHSVTAPNGDKEGQGVSLVEASKNAIPCVSTRHNGFSDVIIEGKTGFLVDEHDLMAMAERMYDLVTDEQLRSKLGEAAQKHIHANFSRESEIKQTIDLFEKVVNR